MEVDCYLKWYIRWLRLLTMLLPRLDLYYAGPLALWRFSQLFQPNVDEYQKNVSPSKREAPGTVPYYGKTGLSYCITSVKRLDEGLR